MNSISFSRLLALSAIVALCSTAEVVANPYALRISNAATMSASSVELDVIIESGNQAAAIAFAIEFDESRLKFSSTPGAVAVPNIAVDVPEGFVASSFFIPGSSGRIGVAVYDPTEPIMAIPDGRIARLRFDTLPGASGFAFVRIASNPAPSAADAAGRALSWNGSSPSGGVTVTTRRAHLTLSPSSLRFGSVPAGSVETRTIAVTNTGTAPLRIREVRISGSAAFTLGEAPSQTVLPPDATRLLEVTFSAENFGTHEAHIELGVEDPTRSTRYISLSGEVAPEGAVVFDSRWLLPAAARMAGAHDSAWRTSLTLANTGNRPAQLRMTLLGSARVLAESHLTLAAGTTKTYEDVVDEMFHAADASGFVLIESSSPDLVARSSTSNVFSDGRLLGQSVPVLAWEDLLHQGDQGWLVGLERSPLRRSNVSVINPGSVDAVIRVELRAADGTTIGHRDYLVPPMLALQGIDIFTSLDVSDAKDLSAAVTCITENCVFFAYASTVGNNSSPIFQSVR